MATTWRPATGPWLGGLPCEWRVDRASKGPSLGMCAVAHPSRWVYWAVRFDSAPHHTGFQPGHRFWLLFGGGAEFAAQVCHHLSNPRAPPLPPLDHSRPWTQWHALTLLFGLCRLCGGLQIVVRAPDGGFRQRFGGGDRGLDGRGAGLRRAVGRGVAGRDLSPRRCASVGWLASIDAIESVGLVGEWRPAGARARCGLLVASWLCCVVCACQQPAAG